jgi:hypothetical protein
MIVLSCQVCCTGTYEEIFPQGKRQFSTFRTQTPGVVAEGASDKTDSSVVDSINYKQPRLCSEAINKAAVICRRGDKAQVK